MSNDGLGFTLVTVGGVLVYAGIRGFSVLEVLGDLISGTPPNKNINKQPLTVAAPTDTTQVAPGGRVANSAIAKTNQGIASPLAGGYGWDTGAQWDSLLTLWTKESDWDNHANNASSGAYGIPQSLPYTKMPKAAWPESAGGTSDAATQIEWGLKYIAGRYGLPQFALAFHNQNNWY